jgi:hypothetical protein
MNTYNHRAWLHTSGLQGTSLVFSERDGEVAQW